MSPRARCAEDEKIRRRKQSLGRSEQSIGRLPGALADDLDEGKDIGRPSAREATSLKMARERPWRRHLLSYAAVHHSPPPHDAETAIPSESLPRNDLRALQAHFYLRPTTALRFVTGPTPTMFTYKFTGY
jgi:hypothetical protein